MGQRAAAGPQDTADTYRILGTIPGHAEAGMVGTLIVK
jgi:uncharacterized cupredoxin-like copper-binding protein